uniref:Methylosome subunit pICln n=1 Tax=Colobus angolensis palliatus TaxID=336983 RepID=A0A2K5JGZ2_COLAP
SFFKSFPLSGPQQSDTKAVVNGKSLSTGTLYIAESHLSWLDDSGLRFSLEYPTICLHALSRDRKGSKESVADEEEENSDNDVEPITEFRFAPSDKSALEAMFTAMCECQYLHPDDREEYDVEVQEQGQGDIPTFYTYEEGFISSNSRGPKGMLSQSVSSQYHMAGVRTEDSIRDDEAGIEANTTSTVAGQFEDTDVDH